MRVLAIAQRRRAAHRDGQHRRERLGLIDRAEPACDRAVIGCGGGEGLGGEQATLVEAGLAGRDDGVIGGIGDDRDISVILGGGAHHAGATDVDVLDHRVAVGATGNRRLERVEVDDDEVDRADAVVGHRLGMLGVVAHREQAAVDHRVQRLDAAVHHLREAGKVADVLHGQAGVAQRLGGAAGRDELDALVGQRAGEIDDSRLVGHGQQGAADGDRGHDGPSGGGVSRAFPSDGWRRGTGGSCARLPRIRPRQSNRAP